MPVIELLARVISNRDMVVCHLWFMINGSWLMVEADGKQAEAHCPENSSGDVERDECGTGREGSSAVHGQLYRLLRL